MRHGYRILLRCLLLAVIPWIAGCQALGYYGQLATGQWRVISARQPVDQLVQGERTDSALRERLAYASAVLRFAEEELALPVGDTYSTYADLGRSPALWAVYAAPRFSTEPRTWCFPIAGCTAYRGYFSRQAAEAFASAQQEQGHDTYIAGVRAYSTLGWFSDPLLNTFLFDDDIDLAALLFHELAHQVAYVPGDTAFNEGLATFVERAGTQRWMNHLGRDGQLQEQSRRRAARERFVELVGRTRENLRRLYAGGGSADRMAREKQRELERLQQSFERETVKMPELSDYAGWIGSGLNNAKLATVSTYHDQVPAFERLFRETGSFPAFFAACRDLAQRPPAERRARMAHAAQ